MSSTSLINGGLLRSTFKRYWPLWLGFFCAWIVLHVMPLFGMLSVVAPDAFESVDLAAAQQNSWYLMQGQILPITWAGAIIAAVYLNERLFKAQAATFYGSLPLRRSTVFVTTVFAVFVPMVLVEALVALVLLALTSTIAGVSAYMVAQWFVLAAGFTFVFCSIAQLACEVTGSRAVAGLLYLLANVLAACIEGAISLISQVLLFGVQISEMTLDWASPAVGLLRGCLQGEALGSSNWMLLGMYCLMAVVLLVLAYWLDGKRGLETAGDAVSFGVLRPVLKYLAGVCSALLLGAIVCIYSWMQFGVLSTVDLSGAVLMALVMAAGAFLGILFAQMVLEKSTRVFGKVWKGGLILACASALIVGACYADPFNVTYRVPQADEVETVELLNYGFKVADIASDDGVESVVSLHQGIIDGKDDLRIAAQPVTDEGYNGLTVGIVYHLKNGSLLQRNYPIYYSSVDQDAQDASSTVREVLGQVNSIVNGAEARLSRIAPAIESPEACTIEVRWYPDGLDAESKSTQGEEAYVEDSDGMATYTLSKEQAASFVKEALEPDVREADEGVSGGVATSYFWYEDARSDDNASSNSDNATTFDVSIAVYDEQGRELAWYDLDSAKTPHSVKWVKRNLANVALHPAKEG